MLFPAGGIQAVDLVAAVGEEGHGGEEENRRELWSVGEPGPRERCQQENAGTADEAET